MLAVAAKLTYKHEVMKAGRLGSRLFGIPELISSGGAAACRSSEDQQMTFTELIRKL